MKIHFQILALQIQNLKVVAEVEFMLYWQINW